MASPGTQLKPVAAIQTAANRLSLDYSAEAGGMRALPFPIIDVHSHISGVASAKLYGQVARTYGIGLTYSMSPLAELETLRATLGERIRFIAVPNYRHADKRYHLGRGYVEAIEKFHAAGARIAKFWAAPRAIDYGYELGDPDFMKIDHPLRIEAMQIAADLGMVIMAHIADPDTWFRARYTDSKRYGTKPEQYHAFEKLLDRFDRPWIAAHMGGWPENLEFLSGLLERHPNLHVDTSATKWMVRELSRQTRNDLVEFLTRFRGRVLFGSDIVALEEHLSDAEGEYDATRAASDESQAFELYASRYWALRTLFETRYVGPSPIADPDLEMVDPERFGPMDAPPLIGKALPDDLLRSVYYEAAHDLLEPLHAD